MQPPTSTNTRYQLELERNALLEKKYEFDDKYSTFTFAFLTSFEAFALLAYIYVATVLIYYKQTRTKTNFIVSVWAVINFAVLLEKLSRAFGVLIGEDFPINEDVLHVSEMVSALGRSYGTLLAVAWVFSKYFGKIKSRYNAFMYFAISVPAIICFYYIYYYFAINKFIFEAYGPGCDVVNAAVYLLVGFILIMGKIFVNSSYEPSVYPLLIAIVNLITSLPVSLMTIYLRYNLDESWDYRLKIYFIDFVLQALICISAFAALFILMVYNETVRFSIFAKKDCFEESNEEEQTKMKSDIYA